MVKNNLSRAVVALTLIVLGAILTFLVYDFYSKQMESYKQHKLSNMKDVYSSAMTAFESATKVAFVSEINTSGTLSIFAKATKERESDDKVRDELRSKLLLTYESLKNVGLKQLHFHLPNGQSFLRMHKPNEYGDYLFGVRPTVKAVNLEKRYVTGFEEGRIYNGFRYVYPLFWENRHIGSVETSISSQAITNHIYRSVGQKYGLFIDKDVVFKTVFTNHQNEYYEPTLLSDNLLIEKDRVKDQLLSRINEKLKGEVAERIKAKKEFIVDTAIDGKNYAVVFMPLKNFLGEYVGYFVWYSPDSMPNSIKIDFFQKLTYIAFGIALIAFVLFRMEKEIEKRRSAEDRLQKLNDGLEAKVAEKLKEIREKDEILLRQSRHASMGEMISVIAHQWKQPLNIVSVMSQEIHYAVDMDDEIDREFLKKLSTDINGQVAYMAKTIDDFRGFFSPKKSHGCFSLSECIGKAIDILDKHLKKDGIEVVRVGEDFGIYGKQNDMMQVVINILNNAQDQIKAVKAEDKRIIVEFDKKYKEIKISDKAGGIKEGDMPLLFEPYFTTKGEEKGTGIGLYMCRLIMREAFGGDITASNGEGGAVFTLSFESVC